jgi:hypothetical protein
MVISAVSEPEKKPESRIRIIRTMNRVPVEIWLN